MKVSTSKFICNNLYISIICYFKHLFAIINHLKAKILSTTGTKFSNSKILIVLIPLYPFPSLTGSFGAQSHITYGNRKVMDI